VAAPAPQRRTRLGRQADTKRVDAPLDELPPGQSPGPYHAHPANEELLIIVWGRPTSEGPDGWRQLAPATSSPSQRVSAAPIRFRTEPRRRHPAPPGARPGRIFTRSSFCCLSQEKVERVGSGGDRTGRDARANHPPHPAPGPRPRNRRAWRTSGRRGDERSGTTSIAKQSATTTIGARLAAAIPTGQRSRSPPGQRLPESCTALPGGQISVRIRELGSRAYKQAPDGAGPERARSVPS
jgi:hypothetical protein